MSKTEIIYDIAIIGGGPAGATFAREIVSKDPSLKVIIIEKKDGTHSKVCGGLLSPDAQKELAHLGMTLPKWVLSDPQIFTVETIDLCTKQKRYYQRHYLNMDRKSFDAWLFSLIPDSVTKANGLCTSIEKLDGLFSIKIKTPYSTKSIFSRVLVGADGGASFVRRSFFDSDIYRYVAIQQHFKTCTDNMPSYSCIFDRKTSDSCSWTIKKDGHFIVGGAFNIKSCRKNFETQKKRFEEYVGYPLGEYIKTEACLLSNPRHIFDFKLSKNNTFLIGEAAGFISASSFEGISYAIRSGVLLAECFDEYPKIRSITKKYKLKTLSLRIKLTLKIAKRHILCAPLLRFFIMKSGIGSIKKYK